MVFYCANLKFPLCLNFYGGVEVQFFVFLTLVLYGDDRSASSFGHFSPGERAPNICWIGGWMGLSVGVDIMLLY
jgi:hypothetical protein